MFKDLNEAEAFAKVLLWGPPGAGKSTQAIWCAISLHKGTGAPVFILDTENALQAAKAIFDAAGVPVQAMQTTRPEEATKAVRHVEQSKGILVLDSGTDLYRLPRAAWMSKHGKTQIPLNAYTGIDQPFNEFVEVVKWAKCHIVYTLKAKNDKDVVDENEQTFQVADGKGLEYIARVKCAMSATKKKGAPADITMLVTDDAAVGKTFRATNPTQELCDKLMARFIK